MKTKHKLIALAMIMTSFTLTSCWSIRKIGKIPSVSVNPIDSNNKYQLLQPNVIYTLKEAKKHRNARLEDAIDSGLKKVNGGQYFAPATITILIHNGFFRTTYGFVVEGDVWGTLPASK